ncbi:MAG: C40 family peptidase [Methylophaga sp.]|nr:C40 family peptidase [Methylophaga sp.]
MDTFYKQHYISRLLWLSALSLLLTACGSQHATRDQTGVIDALYAQYNDWRGAPYQLGGLSKEGVDCSGFVYRTFKDRFDVILPRTTATQVKRGRRVYIGQLETGDLVFFKTGWRTRHVGIYLENGRFLHASTSKGVIISRLDNVYWKNKYWRAQRILD